MRTGNIVCLSRPPLLRMLATTEESRDSISAWPSTSAPVGTSSRTHKGVVMSLTVERLSGIERTRFFIDGKWVQPRGGVLREQTEAATGDVIGVAALGSE